MAVRDSADVQPYFRSTEPHPAQKGVLCPRAFKTMSLDEPHRAISRAIRGANNDRASRRGVRAFSPGYRGSRRGCLGGDPCALPFVAGVLGLLQRRSEVLGATQRYSGSCAGPRLGRADTSSLCRISIACIAAELFAYL